MPSPIDDRRELMSCEMRAESESGTSTPGLLERSRAADAAHR
jgi:hypothetical protein